MRNHQLKQKRTQRIRNFEEITVSFGENVASFIDFHVLKFCFCTHFQSFIIRTNDRRQHFNSTL